MKIYLVFFYHNNVSVHWMYCFKKIKNISCSNFDFKILILNKLKFKVILKIILFFSLYILLLNITLVSFLHFF